MPNKILSIKKIVSGGQTGVDRAAWDFAFFNDIPIGGFVPKGRLAEDGPIDTKYGPMIETVTTDPAERTKLNVLQSDATLIIKRGELSGGTKLTLEIATAMKRPYFTINLTDVKDGDTQQVKRWLVRAAPRILNIAGPRESESPGIYRETLEFLAKAIKRWGER